MSDDDPGLGPDFVVAPSSDEKPAVVADAPAVTPDVPRDALPPAEARSIDAPRAPIGGRETPEHVAKLTVAKYTSDGAEMIHVALSANAKTVFERANKRPEKRLLVIKDPEVALANLDWLVLRPLVRDLLAALRDLREQRPDLWLLIEEHCNSDIPWEMLPFCESRLGAEVTTSRWFDLADTTANARYINHGDVPCEGRRRSFASPDEIPRMQAPPDGDLEAFVAALGGDTPDVALIYVLCHGINTSSDLERMFLGTYSEKGQRIRFVTLHHKPMPLLKKSPVVVFLNCCGSALGDEAKDYLLEGAHVGFAHLFLRKGAKGVIATIADVDTDLAREFAAKVDEKLAAEPTRPLAEILREVRKEAHAKEQDSDAALTRSYVFHLYVLIGDPRVKVRLVE